MSQVEREKPHIKSSCTLIFKLRLLIYVNIVSSTVTFTSNVTFCRYFDVIKIFLVSLNIEVIDSTLKMQGFQ